MLREIRKENPELAHTLIELRRAAKAHDAPIWADVARKLARPRHQVEPVNVAQLERLASANDTIVVPGKLLAQGVLSKPLTVAAFHYSETAREKVHTAGGITLGIHDLIKARPNGTGVRIIA
jgi:large subunit ribosomal protein L18e